MQEFSFESSVNSDSIQTGHKAEQHAQRFESSVNSDSIQTVLFNLFVL